MNVAEQELLGCPLVDSRSGHPYSVVVVAPSVLVHLEAVVNMLLVEPLAQSRSSLLAVLRSVLMLKTGLILSSRSATHLLLVLAEAVEVSAEFVPVPRDPDDVTDLVQESLVEAHRLAVAAQA